MSTPAEPFENDSPAGRGDLHEHLYVLLKHRSLILAIFLACTAAAAIHAFLTRNVYRGTVQILIERDAPQVLSFKEVTQVEAGRDDYYQTQYKLLQSRALARRTIENLNLLADPEFGGPRDPERIEAIKAEPEGHSREMEGAIGAFVNRLTVTPIRNSRLVTVSFDSSRPELAASAANALAHLYITQALEFRYQISSEASAWLETQIAEQHKKVSAAEIALQHLKEKEGIVNLEERRTLLDQKLKELGTALTTLRTERLQKEALFREMRSAAHPEELSAVMGNPLIQSLRVNLADLERQQAQLLDTYVERHPDVIRVRNQIQETRQKIAGEAQRVIRAAENDYRSAAAQEASLASALEGTKKETLDLSRRSIQYDTIKKEQDASKVVLDSLMSRSKQTDVAQELKSSNIRIVDAAVIPRGPIRPNRQREILLGLMLGLIAGIGLAYFLEYIDNTIKTPDDVQKRLGVPLLGVVPEMLTRDHALVGERAQQGPFAEGYRVLRTALSYSWPEPASRVVLITSTGPGEGKTMTSVNLSLILASVDARVLLIDADLRRPGGHRMLNVKKQPGLSDVLVGQVRPSDAIQAIAGSRLAFLPSGTHAPSPAELMTGATMKGFLDGLRRFYQWVIIDTPPVGPVTEPLLLAPACDGIVVVAGAEMTPYKAVLRTIERLSDAKGRILGVVLNRAQIEKHAYYYNHYYGHYYGTYHERGGPRKVASINSRRAAG